MSKDIIAPSAVVLLSGGQDSATCLAWAKKRFGEVHAVSFLYGQRHVAELDAARIIGRMLDVATHITLPTPLDHGSLAASSALVDKTRELQASGGFVDAAMPEGLPTSFVPGRNMIFLALAAARAVAVGTTHLVTGVCQTDYSGYPDCRATFIDAMRAAISLAMPSGMGSFQIHTPLMFLTKAETVKLAMELEAMSAVAQSVTCYFGERPGCGTCPACSLREQGFNEAGVPDPARA